MFNGVLESRLNVADNLTIITLKAELELKPFLPGQYIAIGLPGSSRRPGNYPPESKPPAPDKLIKRQYSIASCPQDLPFLELYVTLLPDGLLTSRLAALRPGDRVWIANKIAGTFTLKDVPAGDNLFLVATGTGIAPYVSMLRTSSTWNSDRSITLLHGVRYSSDLGYREELEELANRRSNFRYLPVVSRKDNVWQGERGYVQDLIRRKTAVPVSGKDRVFLCGNPAMIEDMTAECNKLGFSVKSGKNPQGTIHVEKYW